METMAMTPKDYLDILKRRKWSLVIPALIIFLIAAAVALALPSIYMSTSTILIEEQEIPADFVMTTVTSYVEQRLQSINQRIMSYTKLSEIIKRFNLYADLEDKLTAEEIVEKMKEDTVLEPVSTEVVDRRTGRPTAATIAFTLSYQGENPNTVQQVANVLTSLFLTENLQVRENQAKETAAFLESEMDKIKEKLAELEAQVAIFKNEHINELPELLQLNLQTLDRVERDLSLAKEQLRTLNEKKVYYQTQLAGTEPFLETDEDMVSQRRLEELKVELVHLTKTFSDEYPDVRKTRAEIKHLEEQLAAAETARKAEKKLPNNPAYISLKSQLTNILAEINLIQHQIKEFEIAANEYRRRIAATPEVEEAYNALIAERNNTQAKFDDLMRKHMEAGVAQGLEKEQKGERFTLIDPARLPEKPIKPNRLAIMLIGVVLGIGAGIGFAALREFSDDAVRTPDQLEHATKFPVLAGIPSIVTRRDIVIRRWKRIAVTTGTLGVIVATIVVFHFMVMDLNVFWAKLVRRLAI